MHYVYPRCNWKRVESFDESIMNVDPPPNSMTNQRVCAKVVADGPGCHEPECLSRLLGYLDLSQCDYNPQQLEDLKALLSEHTVCFALYPSECGCCGMVQHVIDTRDMPPLKQQPCT